MYGFHFLMLSEIFKRDIYHDVVVIVVGFINTVQPMSFLFFDFFRCVIRSKREESECRLFEILVSQVSTYTFEKAFFPCTHTNCVD